MENMLAALFTKPLQGAAFQNMRDHILNMPSTSNASEAHGSVSGKEKNGGTKENKEDKKEETMTTELNGENTIVRKFPRWLFNCFYKITFFTLTISFKSYF